MRTRASITVGTDAERTFALLTDPTRFHEWQTGTAPAHVDGGVVGVGSRLHARRRLAGMTVPFTTEVVAWEPPRRMAFRSVRAPLRVHGEYRVDPTDGGARVTAEIEVGVPGWGPLRLGDRAADFMRDQLARDLSSLARLLDRPTEQGGG